MIDAIRDHVHQVHGWMFWPERPWDSMVMHHTETHERLPGLEHEHDHLPGVTW
jgi:hypothetical protein